MNLVEFPEQNIVIAKDQPQYMPMPAHVSLNEAGTVTCCWDLSGEEIAEIVKTGKIWHSILTFGAPLQPQLLSVYKPEMGE